MAWRGGSDLLHPILPTRREVMRSFTMLVLATPALARRTALPARVATGRALPLCSRRAAATAGAALLLGSAATANDAVAEQTAALPSTGIRAVQAAHAASGRNSERREQLARSSVELAALLVRTIPSMPYGAPATNVTLPLEVVQDIETQASALEALGARNMARSAKLSGTWRLVYSNGREIANLATGLPLGFVLGPTYQPVDVAGGRFENQGSVVHVLGLARASTTVVGDVRIAEPGTLNAAGTVNARQNRVDVDFRRLVFALDELGGVSTNGLPRKIIQPRQDPAAAQPANDVTYLDDDVRVTRGGDDSLFIFARDDSGGGRPLLTRAEREKLYAESPAADVRTGDGVAADSAPPELKRLLRR